MTAVPRRVWDDLISDEDRAVYAPFEQRMGFGARPAVLAVDLYNAVFGEGPEPILKAIERFPSSCGPRAWEAVPHVRRLLEEARSAGVPVIYTTKDPRPEAQTQAHRSTKGRGRLRASDASWNFAILEELKPADGDLILYKPRASAFFGTPLIGYLTSRSVDTLIVCGESTSGCVRATVVDGFSYGFRVAVVEEGTFDRSWTTHCLNLFDMHQKYADVVGIDEVVAYLRQLSTESSSGENLLR